MIYILEGPDGAGKSTLAQQLHQITGGRVVHNGPPIKGESLFQRFHDQLVEHARTPTQVTIFDRFHISESVYGPVFRDQDLLGIARFRMLERVLLDLDTVLIHCDPGVDQCLANWEATKGTQYIQQLPTQATIVLNYPAKVFRSELATIRYDYREKLDAMLIKLAQLEDTQVHSLGAGAGRRVWHGCGDWQPGRSTLIVGEELSEGGVWPFVLDGGCSPWLAEQLERDGIPERGRYWINAWEPGKGNTRSTDPAILTYLQPRRVLALGKQAEAWGKAYARDRTISFPHPQYHKRFHAQEPYPIGSYA